MLILAMRYQRTPNQSQGSPTMGPCNRSPTPSRLLSKVAREALAQTIFTEKPHHRYKIQVGLDIGKELPGEKKSGQFGGYVSQPVSNSHIIPDVLNEAGEPIFIDPASRPSPYNNILHNLGIGMRGSDRSRYAVVADGMHLDSAFQHVEHRRMASSPNLKMLIRDFPVQGNFAFRVTAARTSDVTLNFEALMATRTKSPKSPSQTEKQAGRFPSIW